MKARSPRYPQISLPEAIEKVRAVYDADHLNQVPKEVVANHMGYGSLNGKSLGVISAVSKYGLLTGNMQGMKVSSRALSILVNEPGDPDRVRGIQEAAREPALFKELFEQFPSGASDQALKAFLLGRKKFTQGAVEGAIRAYRGTLDLIEREANEPDFAPEESLGDEEVDVVAPIRPATSRTKISEVVGSAFSMNDAPFDIGFIGTAIRISGILDTREKVEKVVSALNSLKSLLPEDR